MKRKLFDRIKNADRESKKRLIILSGMKGTGKTFGLLEYIRSAYEEYLYIDAAHDAGFRKHVSTNKDLELGKLIAGFFRIDEEYLFNIPVIIDEPSADMSEAELFNDFDSRLKIFVIVSDFRHTALITEAARRFSVDFLVIDVKPLDFGEFLTAIEKEWYEEVISGHLMRRRRIPEMIHQELLDLYDLYLQVGGMPEIVSEYLRLGTLENIRERQLFLKGALWCYYTENASGDTEQISGSRVRGILDAVEKALEKDNHKFMFSLIRDGVTRKQYMPSLDYICSKGVLLKVDKYRSNGGDFRLYYGDISLYSDPMPQKISESVILQGIFSSGMRAYYWESGKGASLDCIVEKNGVPVPIDIHSNGKGALRSIRSFMNENGGDVLVRLSEDNCRFDGNEIMLPVYAAYKLNLVL